MVRSYFQQLVAETPTRVWVNNPTLEEIDLALEAGAVGSTTNPAFGGGLVKRAPTEILPIISECVRLSSDDLEVAELVQQRLVARIAERFRPLYDSSGGRAGFVSIQGAPEADTDRARIVAEGRTARTIAPNATPKLPATAPGLAALEVLVGEGSPIIVTEVFSLAQLVETCERYLAVTTRTGIQPPFFISPITGIFGDHLKAIAVRDHLAATNADMELAGVVLSRACYRLVVERGYPVTLLLGGSRVPFDLTGLVGAGVHVTINWKTFAEVLADPAPFARGIDESIDEAAVERLVSTFDDVRRALAIDGLRVDEFEAFGPVQHFRNNFIAGWHEVLDAIGREREALVRS